MGVIDEQIQSPVRRILTEDVIDVPTCRKEIAELTGKRPDKTTVYRWFFRGVGGVKLEHIRIGKTILTSRQALTRFIEARSR